MTAGDFAAAMQRVGPSIVRGAAVEVSPVSWGDVGGYADVKMRLQQAVEWPLQHAGVCVRVCARSARCMVVLFEAFDAPAATG